MAEIDIFYRGDTIELEFQQYQNKTNNTFWNLTNHQIRFSLKYNENLIKKATSNISGGSSNQINVIDAEKGKFLVIINKDESKLLEPGEYVYEIEITTPENKRYTVLQHKLKILSHIIDWETI